MGAEFEEVVMKVIHLILVEKPQCSRPPVPFRIACHLVKARPDGNGSLRVPVDDPWWMMEAGLAAFEPGFRMTREDGALGGSEESWINFIYWCEILEMRSSAFRKQNSIQPWAVHLFLLHAVMKLHNFLQHICMTITLVRQFAWMVRMEVSIGS